MKLVDVMLIHLGDFSEQNSLALACGLGKRALFLDELSTAIVEKDQDKITLEYSRGTTVLQYNKGCTVKAVSENGNGSVQECV